MSNEADQKPLATRLTDTIKSTVPNQESEIARWRRTFDRHAKDAADGQKYLDPSSFIDAVAPTEEGFNRISRQQYSILFRVADSSNRGHITFDEFVVFETLLKRPDADYQLAFRVFDVDGSGTIDYDQFKSVLSANLAASEIPFDFECDWIRLYLGKRGGNHIVGFQEFAQLLKGFRGERVRQAFRYFDTDNDGFIAPTEFQRIMVEIAGHKLSDSIIQRLPTVSLMTPGQRISYSEVFAFHNIIRELDAVEKTIQRATRRSKDGKIDVTDFLDEAATARNSVFTPLEASIIFHMASRGAASTTQRLSIADFDALLDAKWTPPPTPTQSSPTTSALPTTTSALAEIGEFAYSFSVGGLAGATGALAVYPIDFVKTRMQNQRSTVVGEVLYRNPLDCVQKIYRHEGGIRGFYRGTVPQMIGVAPEKSIKLVVNGYVRSKFTNPDTGAISLGAEILAGGAAGFCQVSVTCPLEITKIRLQMAGEIARQEGHATKQGIVNIIRGLGLVGLYKGAVATMARDVPFSAIYFPAYAHMKKDVFHEGRQAKTLSLTELLLAAGAGGVPAAYLTTPFDVAKTRLQSQARAGETVYRGLPHALVTIVKEEGFRALFKGGIFRVVRSSPQFAVTLTVYEIINRNFPNPFASPSAASSTARPIRATTDISRVRARNALRILLDCSSSFGMVNDKMVARGLDKLPKQLRSYPTVGKELA